MECGFAHTKVLFSITVMFIWVEGFDAVGSEVKVVVVVWVGGCRSVWENEGACLGCGEGSGLAPYLLGVGLPILSPIPPADSLSFPATALIRSNWGKLVGLALLILFPLFILNDDTFLISFLLAEFPNSGANCTYLLCLIISLLLLSETAPLKAVEYIWDFICCTL